MKTKIKQFTVSWITTRGAYAERHFASKGDAKRFQAKVGGQLFDALFGLAA